MLALARTLCMLLALGAGVPVLAQDSAAADKSGEVELARELLAQRQKLDVMKADPGASREAVLAQERRLMEVRARLSAALAGELARQTVDSDQWSQAWEGMKELLRERLRGWLDEKPAAEPGTTRT